MTMLEVKLEGLALDMTTNTPVIILAPVELEKVLPIWIGHAEAWAIAMELSGVASKRPLTHDLIRQVIETMGGKVDRVEITDLKEQTFFAVIQISRDGKTERIDARPSDSIAVALKTGAQIYVNEDLFTVEAQDTSETPAMPTDRESLRERLRNINPEDFGKYSL
ncbi:MAG: bifunctional nuclease family protein [Candidatus Zixiibacteriota bacterium]|nr:MAG: bifunctional nuclease family protein [candidate division Zixibacteria bacterium]